MKEQRMKWDAEAAFKRMNRALSIREPHERGHAYTPPSNIGPERLAQLRKYEPPAKHGRDIGSLMRYHAAHKKGRTDDDCLAEKFGASSARSPEASEVGGLTKTPTHAPNPPSADCLREKFGSVGKMVIPTPGQQPLVGAGSSPAAPTPPHSADGGQPLPSASTKPHGKDVDTPWPKCVNWFGIAVYVFAGPAKNQGLYHRDDGTTDRAAGDYADRLRNGGVSMSTPEASQWLEAHGHADVAAQLRGKDEFEPVGTVPVAGDVVRWGSGLVKVSRIDSTREFSVRFNKPDGGEDGLLMSYFGRTIYDPPRILKRPTSPRDDVATGGGRVWTGSNHCVRVWTGARMMIRGRDGKWAESRMCVADLDAMAQQRDKDAAELFGPERDAIVAECRKAMGL